ncbi:deoxyribodipyrimidine photo-lyase, partial [Roseateles sp. GG27B]
MKKALLWFRRDLRADDQAALYQALRSAEQVYCVFVLDSDILSHLPRADRRVEFLLAALRGLEEDLRRLNPQARLIVRHGR